VDPVPDPLLLRKSGSAGKRTRASRSVAGNSVLVTDLYPAAFLVVDSARFAVHSPE
jgi:hypothetical protein